MKGEFYKMEFRAWNLGTVDLTLEQEAAYLRLCHAMYDAGGPVPNSVRFLMTLFRCGNAKATALVNQLVEAGKIAVTADGRLYNHRVSEELLNRERVSSARRLAGERGGTASGLTRAKSLENINTDEAIASTPRTREEKRREDTPKAPKGAEPEGFAEWWEEYPKRDGGNPRAPAAAKYAVALKAGATPETLLRAVRAYRAELERKAKLGTEFVKQAQFWLSQKQWQDYASKPETASPAMTQTQQDDEKARLFPEHLWRAHIQRWNNGLGSWLVTFSAQPDSPRTRVPSHILAEFGITHQRAA